MTLRRLIAVAVTLLLGCALLPTAYAAPTGSAFMTIAGTKGKFEGDVMRKGFEKNIEVIAFEQTLTVSLDRSTGQASGKAQHGLVQVTKRTDPSTPPLRTALISNETLKDVTLQFLAATSGSPVEIVFYKVVLKNARVTSIHHAISADGKTGQENIELAYETIEWTWSPGVKPVTASASIIDNR